MNKIVNLFYVILFVTYFCPSCNPKAKTNSENVNSNKSYIDKEIIFPGESILFTEDTTILIDSAFFNNDMIKIVHLINVNCSNCLNELIRWNSFISMIEDDCEIIFWLNNTDNNEFKVQNLIQAENNIHFVSDHSQSFEHLNDLAYPDINLHTFLLDRNNKIKLMGDPISDKMLISEYMNTIAFLNNNNN